MEHVSVCISERQAHIGCQLIMDQKLNDANGCISVHALMDWGQDVYQCAHMYMNVCLGQSSQPDHLAHV